jgi:hypothetical protein
MHRFRGHDSLNRDEVDNIGIMYVWLCLCREAIIAKQGGASMSCICILLSMFPQPPVKRSGVFCNEAYCHGGSCGADGPVLGRMERVANLDSADQGTRSNVDSGLWCAAFV